MDPQLSSRPTESKHHIHSDVKSPQVSSLSNYKSNLTKIISPSAKCICISLVPRLNYASSGYEMGFVLIQHVCVCVCVYIVVCVYVCYGVCVYVCYGVCVCMCVAVCGVYVCGVLCMLL